tara:strand:- start:5427 stop:5921 length:495 start_codon:yes stop_codon:yes gene_type:complete
MKKKLVSIIFLAIALIFINSCTGYKPIFSSSNIKFEIADYSIDGDKKIAKQIYAKLNNLSKNKNYKDQTNVKSIYINIKVSKKKNPTIKNSAGKILEYKINMNTQISVKNYLTGDNLMDSSFNYSSSYKVQDQYSETKKLEDRSLEDLINKTYQDLLIKLISNL